MIGAVAVQRGRSTSNWLPSRATRALDVSGERTAGPSTAPFQRVWCRRPATYVTGGTVRKSERQAPSSLTCDACTSQSIASVV